MNLNLTKPIAFFDLETTGTNISNDRIVEVAIIKVNPDQSEETKTMRINPGIPIPEETSRIHGIYDADVADAPRFSDVADDLMQFLGGCDLGGYNLLKFDIPVLVEEFLRCDKDFNIDNRKIIDAQRIFYLMQPRTLTAAYQYFCNKSLENAHSAEADTRATYEVVLGQIEKYEGVTIKDKDGNEYEPVKNDVAALSKLSLSNFADFAGRLAFNDKGEEVFNFGKHKGKTVASIFAREPSYYDWMMKGDFPLYTKKILTKIKLRSLGK